MALCWLLMAAVLIALRPAAQWVLRVSSSDASSAGRYAGLLVGIVVLAVVLACMCFALLVSRCAADLSVQCKGDGKRWRRKATCAPANAGCWAI